MNKPIIKLLNSNLSRELIQLNTLEIIDESNQDKDNQGKNSHDGPFFRYVNFRFKISLNRLFSSFKIRRSNSTEKTKYM